MPIRPENKGRYPKDWKQIRARILQRARNRCERCGLLNHLWGYRDAFGAFHGLTKAPLADAGFRRPPFDVACNDGRVLRVIEIILTVAHLNHEPEDCRDENLQALCQRCHNRHDVASRRAGIRERRHREQGQLFDEASA